MCNNEAAFINMTSTNGNFLLASDAQTEIVAKGTARVFTTDGKSNRSVKLNDTLLVKELRTNLLSVAKITDHGNTVSFSKTGATIFGKDSEIKLLAQRVGNLYYVCGSEEQANAAINNNSASLKLWHHRLGHLNKEDLLEISRKKLTSGMKKRNWRHVTYV
ncbi:GSCOCG00011173001-RA-CDS [Cotesia congregata]|nr:GSCOCG00011173001-RA-CDS [Cotesia congregata]